MKDLKVYLLTLFSVTFGIVSKDPGYIVSMEMWPELVFVVHGHCPIVCCISCITAIVSMVVFWPICQIFCFLLKAKLALISTGERAFLLSY